MPYALKFAFSSHVGSVNCLSFSPDGRYLATGSDDRTVFVHDCESGLEVHKVQGECPVTALAWHPKHRLWLFIGYGNGKLIFADLSMNQPFGYKFPVQCANPIEALCLDGPSTKLAVCHASRVVVWEEIRRDYWTYVCSMPSPGGHVAIEDLDAPHAPRSCHWLNSGRSLSLVVSYAHHGIICWDMTALSVIWHIPPRNGPTGRSSLTPDGQHLAIHSIADGFDLYKLHPLKCVRTFAHTPIHRVTLPVLFLHGGVALLVGSDAGRVTIYDVGTTLPMQVLWHGSDVIQAMACFEGDTRFIATGSSDMGDQTYVKLWMAPGRPQYCRPSVEREHPKRIPHLHIEGSPGLPDRSSTMQIPRYVSRAVNTSTSIRDTTDERLPSPPRFNEPSASEERPRNRKAGGVMRSQARNGGPDGPETIRQDSVARSRIKIREQRREQLLDQTTSIERQRAATNTEGSLGFGAYCFIGVLLLIIFGLACICLHLYYHQQSGWGLPTIS